MLINLSITFWFCKVQLASVKPSRKLHFSFTILVGEVPDSPIWRLCGNTCFAQSCPRVHQLSCRASEGCLYCRNPKGTFASWRFPFCSQQPGLSFCACQEPSARLTRTIMPKSYSMLCNRSHHIVFVQERSESHRGQMLRKCICCSISTATIFRWPSLSNADGVFIMSGEKVMFQLPVLQSRRAQSAFVLETDVECLQPAVSGPTMKETVLLLLTVLIITIL